MSAKASASKHSRTPLARQPLIRKPPGEEETTRLIHIDRADLRLVERAARKANKSTGYYISSIAVDQAKRDLA